MKKSVIRTGNRVALYARFSSDNQRSESIDAQVRAMKAYCQQQHLIIVEVYEDRARSATTDQRPPFRK
jgi:site-specific DNA recombinase